MTFTNPHQRTRSTIHSFILLLLITITTFLPSLTSASCNNFTPALWNGYKIYTAPSLASQRISAKVNCSGSALATSATSQYSCNSTQCGLASANNLLIDVNSSLNITTTSDDQISAILSSVKANVSELAHNNLYNFNTSLTVIMPGVTYTCINQGTTKYYAFTSDLICADGVLSGCDTNGGIANGTAVQACGIKLLFLTAGGLGDPDGMTSLVDSDGPSEPAPSNVTIIEVAKNSANGMLETPSWWWWAVAGVGVAIYGIL